MGLYSLITTGNIMNKDFCFKNLVYELDPFDFKTFSESKTKFYATVTNLETGEAEYPQIGLFPPLPAAVTADEAGLATLPQVEPGMYFLDIWVPGEELSIKRVHLTITEGKTSTRILFLKDEQ